MRALPLQELTCQGLVSGVVSVMTLNFEGHYFVAHPSHNTLLVYDCPNLPCIFCRLQACTCLLSPFSLGSILKPPIIFLAYLPLKVWSSVQVHFTSLLPRFSLAQDLRLLSQSLSMEVQSLRVSSLMQLFVLGTRCKIPGHSATASSLLPCPSVHCFFFLIHLYYSSKCICIIMTRWKSAIFST
jgi:hypothetical protein